MTIRQVIPANGAAQLVINYDGGGLEVNSSLLNVILHDQPPIKM